MSKTFHLWMISFLLLQGCIAPMATDGTIDPTITVTRVPLPTKEVTTFPNQAPTESATQTETEEESPSTVRISIENVEQLTLQENYRDVSSCVQQSIDNKEEILFCSDGVFLQSDGKETQVGWEAFRPYYPFRLPYIDDQTRRIAASVDGQVLAMINDLYRIVVFDRAGTLLADLDPPKGDPEMTFIALSPDGRYLAIESDFVDQFLRVFDVQLQTYINLPQYNALQLRFSKDNQFLYFYELEKSWEAAKLKVLAIPGWEKAEKSAAMKDFDMVEKAFADYPTRFTTKSDYGEHLGGFFKVTAEKDGLWVNSSAIQVGPGEIDGTLYFGDHTFCRFRLGSTKECTVFSESMLDRSDVLLSGNKVYPAITSVAKTTAAGNPLEGVTTIYGGDPAENLVIDSLPDFARIYQFSPKYHLAFYQPFGFDEVFNVFGTERQAAYYNLASQKILVSFETAGRESVAGYISDSYPYAITILNNSVDVNDQFNVLPLDGGHESTAGRLNNTTENTRPVFAMSPDQKFFAVVSTKPQTKKDGIISDHLVLNILHLNNLDKQVYFEVPAIPRPAIVEYNLDRHTQEYEPAAMDMEISPDGQLAVIGMSTGMVYFVDLVSGEIVFELQSQGGGIAALAFSPAGDELFTLDQEGNIAAFGISN